MPLLFIASLSAEHGCEQAGVKGPGPEASTLPPKTGLLSFFTYNRSILEKIGPPNKPK